MAELSELNTKIQPTPAVCSGKVGEGTTCLSEVQMPELCPSSAPQICKPQAEAPSRLLHLKPQEGDFCTSLGVSMHGIIYDICYLLLISAPPPKKRQKGGSLNIVCPIL